MYGRPAAVSKASCMSENRRTVGAFGVCGRTCFLSTVSGESFGILDAIEIDAVSNASCKWAYSSCKRATLGRC